MAFEAIQESRIIFEETICNIDWNDFQTKLRGSVYDFIHCVSPSSWKWFTIDTCCTYREYVFWKLSFSFISCEGEASLWWRIEMQIVFKLLHCKPERSLSLHINACCVIARWKLTQTKSKNYFQWKPLYESFKHFSVMKIRKRRKKKI